jgi:hypothetical protein
MDAVTEFMMDTGALRLVRGSVVPGGFGSLDFVFAHGVLRLRAEADTDEVVITLVEGEDAGLEDLSRSPDFASLPGKIVEYAWWMRNHRGYSDAFQMRFLDLGDRIEATLQFEVAASAIRVSAVC